MPRSCCTTTAARPLELVDLHIRHPGLTAALAKAYHEAACICLGRHHRSPVDFAIRNERRAENVSVRWPKPTARARRAWANQDDATRDAAYLCVIAAAEALEGLRAVRRAETRTGADYYLGMPNNT